jgi:MFS family permease
MQLKKGYDRNYWAMALEGACFICAIPYLATSGVVALFINAMTGSKTLIGLAVTVSALFGLVGQIASAPYVQSIRNLPKYLLSVMAAQRVIPLLMALPLFLGFTNSWSVGIFLTLFGLFWLIDGLMVIPWAELCARALKSELRGHMMGMQITIGGIASLLTGLLLTWLLATPVFSDHHRFGIVFMLASVLLLTSIFFIRLVRDPKPSVNPERLRIHQYYARIPFVLRNSKPLRDALLPRIPSFIGFSPIAFITVFGVSTFDLSEAQISWLVYANIVGGLVGGILLGEASRRYGSKTTILLCNIAVLITLGMAVMLVFFPVLGYIWLFGTCTLAGVSTHSWLGYLNYFIDIAPNEDRPAYQVIGTFISIPFSVVGLVMGGIIDNYGYIATFVIGVIFSVAALLLSLRLLSRREIQASNIS